MTMPNQDAVQKCQERPALSLRRMLTERSVPAMNYEKQLKTSLAFRKKNEKETSAVSDEVGTAEHRPRHGLVYDAPLGLKF